MLAVKLLSDGRVQVSCSNGGGSCSGRADEIVKMVESCRTWRDILRNPPPRVEEQFDDAEGSKWDIFPAMSEVESKFYPKSWV